MVEVRVGVVPRLHLLDGERERLRRQPGLRLSRRGRGRAPGPGTRRARPARPRAARRSAPPWRCGPGARSPGRRSARASVVSGWRVIQPKSSTDAAAAPTAAAARAGPRSCSGAREARTLPTAVVASSGPTRCEPQRSCSFGRRSPCSYVPIETCSAPWYAASSPPRSAASAGASERNPLASSAHERAQVGARTHGPDRNGARGHHPDHAGPLERQLGLGHRALHLREHRERVEQLQRPAEQRIRDAGAEGALPRRGDLDRPVREPDGAAPGRRTVDEDAVRQRHPAQPDLVRGHPGRLSTQSRIPQSLSRRRLRGARPAAPEPRRRAGSAPRPPRTRAAPRAPRTR